MQYTEGFSELHEYFFREGEMFLVRSMTIDYPMPYYEEWDPTFVRTELKTYYIVEGKAVQYMENISRAGLGDGNEETGEAPNFLEDVEKYKELFSK
jgi:hypothetical protein